MYAGLTTTDLALVFGLVAFGGLVKGLAGFGYAIASTAVLATVLDPATAVVVMILPTLVANVTLLRELDADGLRSCARRFWPFVAAAVVGTLAGMAVLGQVPKPLMATGLGVFTLAYVAVKQDRVALPGERWVADRCATTGTAAMVVLGAVSGLVFGASNVGVQVVAYLDSLDLDRSTFVGVLAMILVGVSTVRVGAAWTLGLYPSTALVGVSAAAAVPGLVGVAVGGRLRRRIPDRHLASGVVALLAMIGVRLVAKGALGV